jgi:hypothetical protein
MTRRRRGRLPDPGVAGNYIMEMDERQLGFMATARCAHCGEGFTVRYGEKVVAFCIDGEVLELFCEPCLLPPLREKLRLAKAAKVAR